MGTKNIQESQQASQGITIGTQGNQGGSVPDGQKGPHHKQNEERAIPNQEHSASSKQQKESEERGRH